MSAHAMEFSDLGFDGCSFGERWSLLGVFPGELPFQFGQVLSKLGGLFGLAGSLETLQLCL
jgi:hypothetical protein